MNDAESRLVLRVFDQAGLSTPAESSRTGRGPTWWAEPINDPLGSAFGTAAIPSSWLGDDSPFLLVTDVDATLIAEEVIDQLARRAGVYEAVAEITHRAMAGEMDFEESLRQRVSHLRGLSIDAFADVYRGLHVREGARELFAWVHARGGIVAAVSGGFTPVVSLLADDLGIDHFRAIDLEERGGTLTGRVSGTVVTAAGKRDFLESLRKIYGFRTVALGDGANDIPMLQAADLGIGVCPKAAVRDVTPHILEEPRLDAVVGLLGASLI